MQRIEIITADKSCSYLLEESMYIHLSDFYQGQWNENVGDFGQNYYT